MQINTIETFLRHTRFYSHDRAGMQQTIVEQNRDNVLSSRVGETFGTFGAFGAFGTFGTFGIFGTARYTARCTVRSLSLTTLFARLSTLLYRVPQSALVGVLDCLLQVAAVAECKHRHHVRERAQCLQGWL